MSSSREYYHTSGSRSHTGEHDRHLPPIRDVVGDELDRRNSYTSTDAPGAFGQSSARGGQRGPTLPPIQGRHVSSSSRSGTAHPRGSGSLSSTTNGYASEHSEKMPSQRGGEQHQAHHRLHPGPSSQEQEYAYGVLRNSATGSSLVHATYPAPSRAQGILPNGGTLSQTHDEGPDKRHKCEYCGKKFDRPSSLQVHVRTHTGSQPFTCEWPGCERSFSVRSNMLRHWRSHERYEVSHHASSAQKDGEDDELFDEDYTTSEGQQSGSSYYTSSRRR